MNEGQKNAYAQYGEDQILVFLFQYIEKGFYIDAGCFHPTLYSNTMALYEKGWRGVNIDANPFMIEECKRIRPEDNNLNIALSSEEGRAQYFKFNDWGSSNTIDKDFKDTIVNAQNVDVEEIIEIETYTLETIIKKYAPDNGNVDFLNVDVENLDLEVLKSNDWSTYRPMIVAVEDFKFKFDSPTNSEIYRFMTENNYDMFSRTIYTSFFCDSSRKKETPIWWSE